MSGERRETQIDFVGEAATDEDFVAAIETCGVGGQDTVFGSLAGRLGPRGAAAAIVESTSRMRGGRRLWRIARRHDETVGVVLPTANDGGPVVNYLAVNPLFRGERIVDDLLQEAARLHALEGALRIVADTDVDNRPMQAAFQRNGWGEFAQRTTYALQLDGA